MNNGKILYHDMTVSGGINPLENLQITEMPTPGPSYIGKIYQYTGDTVQDAFNKGSFYECVITERGTYNWKKIIPQATDDGSEDTTIRKYPLYKGIPDNYLSTWEFGQQYEAYLKDNKYLYVSLHIVLDNPYTIYRYGVQICNLGTGKYKGNKGNRFYAVINNENYTDFYMATSIYYNSFGLSYYDPYQTASISINRIDSQFMVFMDKL